MDLGFGEGAGDSEDHSLAFVPAHADADDDEGAAIPYHAVDTDLVVGGVEGDGFYVREGAFAPFFELGIELFGEDGNLAERDFEAVEFFHDFADAACANPFDIQGGDGRFEGVFAAESLLEKGGVQGASL